MKNLLKLWITNSLFNKPNDTVTKIELRGVLDLYLGDQKQYSDDLSSFYPFLSYKEIERSKRFIHKRDERTYVISHACVNRKISGVLNEPFNSVDINYFSDKKPFVEAKSIEFNLSHSYDCFAFAVSNMENLIIGVDIECVIEKTDISLIIDHFFHPNESTYIQNNNISEDKQLKRFYEIWTRKEAFLKMMGLGLTDFLSELDFSPENKEINIEIPVGKDSNYINEVYIDTIYLQNNSIASVATNMPVSVLPVSCLSN